MQFSSALFAGAGVFLTLANAASLDSRSLSGEATFYGGNLAGGTCSFSTYTLPSGVFGTALSDSNWDNAANCGKCVAVTGPSGNTITAMIVDECPGCGENHLDLFPDAFSSLADPSKGVIAVTWDYVDCPITSALELHNKDGVSAYWFSIQVVNANKGVSKVEVSTDGGSTWKSTARQTYNFFENSMGFGTTTVDVKVTSVDGDVIIVNGVDVSSGTSVTASGNFESSGSTVEPEDTSSTPSVESTSSSSPEAASTTSSSDAAPTTIPGGNFEEASTTYTAPESTSAYAAATTSPPSTPDIDLETQTQTTTECPETTLSSSFVPGPSSTFLGIIGNATVVPYPVGTSSIVGGSSPTPTSSIPFAGAASQSSLKIGPMMLALGFALLAIF